MPEIHSRQVKAGRKTFFLDVKKHRDSELAIYITQTTRENEGFERSRIIIPEEVIDDFSSAFVDCLCSLKENSSPEEKEEILEQKASSVEEKRKTHPKAYAPWKEEDDLQLKRLFKMGRKVSELAEAFGRNEGAINSRLRKLELKD